MRRAVVERGAKLIIINPRRIDMCDYADLWLRPRPGTDVALLNAMAKVIVDEGLADNSFVTDRTEGYDEWWSTVQRYDLDYAEKITGVAADDIAEAARIYASPPFSGSCLIWGMGITQHTMGTANAHGLLNLAFVAGQLGRPGSGISPLRGQNNVQGCGDSGCLPNSLPGYQTIGDESIAKFQNAWSNQALPPEPGLVITEMVPAMDSGRIRAMYVTGENPLLSEPDLHHAEETFKKLDFLVVQDIFMHETAQIADVVLPATSFAEKDGTFTNSERRVQRVRKAVEPVGESKADWEIIREVALRLSSKLGLELEHEFDYSHPSEIFDEMASLMPMIAGISYDRLEQEGGIQWPCPEPDHPGTRFLYESDFPRGQRAKFVGFDQGPVADEAPSKRFPLILNTGRTLYHWHGGTITRRADNLLARDPELTVGMNPADGDKYGIPDGEWIRVRSRRGDLEARAVYTERQRAGEIFVPFVKLQEHAANFLTNAALDPNSRIPEYKVCAVRVDPVGEDRGVRARRTPVPSA
jgi:predicted molibdopterin-dependent oxidoreductase YjgC